MIEEANRIVSLQLIPVFALRQLLIELVSEDDEEEAFMRALIEEQLGIKSTGTTKTVKYLSRDQLVQLINVCPAVSDEQIQDLFEEYRYGANPSFFIYLFDPWRPSLPKNLQAFGESIAEELAVFNESKQSVTPPPRLREVNLYDLTSLGPQGEVVEATYTVLKRLEYIDAAENIVSTYETLSGFFWLNLSRGYWIIYERLREAGNALRQATEKVLGIRLRPLIISKELKNNLPFLEPKNLRYSRLHNPDPERDNFLWQTIRDDNPYARRYQDLEDTYPEVRNASYREIVGGKKTSLIIRCDQAKLTLSGKYTATQFRTWALSHLEEIIETLYDLEAKSLPHIETGHLLDIPELSRFRQARQREIVLAIIAKMLALQTAPYHKTVSLGSSPLEMAAALGSSILVRVPLDCPSRTQVYYLGCDECYGMNFNLVNETGNWHLRCINEHRPFEHSLPIQGECEDGEPFEIDEDVLLQVIEMHPSLNLLQVVERVIKRHFDGYQFSSQHEGFYIRGSNLYYFRRPLEESGQEAQISSTIVIKGDVGPNATVIATQVRQMRAGAAAAPQGVPEEPQAADTPVMPDQQPPWDTRAETEEHFAYEDELMPEAIDFIQELHNVSVSRLQRHFRIGYTRAARLIDLLQEMGLVNPLSGTSLQYEVIPQGDTHDKHQ